MNTTTPVLCCALVCAALASGAVALAQQREIPELLKPWQDWATWEDKHRDCPTPYQGVGKPICYWPARLSLAARPQGGDWKLDVRVFEETWVPLPGGGELWPLDVRTDDQLVAVVERDGAPAVKLNAGSFRLEGEFQWEELPQQIAIPQQIGILALTVEGEAVTIPSWDARGNVWLKRLRAQPASEDLLAIDVYRVIEDGIPLWLRTEIELTVSGKSREEQLGQVLPEGWRLSLVESPIPVAVDQQGRIKAQVRAGKWTISIQAFRAANATELRFAADAEPIAKTELVGWKAQPEFRIADLEGATAVDVAQTTFPQQWRDLPVYAWNTAGPLQIVEKMRGLGLRRPAGLNIVRQFWLDEDGAGFTYRDRFQGIMQQRWRLDVAAGQQLGVVRVDGEGQLITADPKTGAAGVEIRSRDLNLEAIGRVARTTDLSATGWQTDADSLRLTLALPPGWRVFALFGADRVDGDWLTAWTLLDLFLVLIFSLAVFRLWGFWAGVVALTAFGLAYHEPLAPRFTWLFLLMPLALLRVSPAGTAARWLTLWKYVAIALLLLCLVPFVARQIQAVIYPQLEAAGMNYAARPIFGWRGHVSDERRHINEFGTEPMARDSSGESGVRGVARQKQSNLQYDANAVIQTGPAVPEWNWNQVYCSWNSPVSEEQRIRPILISLPVHRGLQVVRVALLTILLGLLLGVRSAGKPRSRRAVAAAVGLAVMLAADPSQAQIPGQDMLAALRARLLEPAAATPLAAEIPRVSLAVSGAKIAMDIEIHAARQVAVPVPGRLPAWSPLSVTIDEQPGAVVCRHDDYLWVTVPSGVHRVAVQGMLPELPEWEWTFLLKPRRVTIDAPDWNVTGIGRHGVPEQQVFFSRRRETTAGEATYDQKNFESIVVVERNLEIGLVWKVHNRVTRLSSLGKAVTLQVPLLVGERILSPNAVIENSRLAIRLGAQQKSSAWESELPVGEDVRLRAAPQGQWVERWRLVTSPVWNVTVAGLTPLFEPDAKQLVPTWHPWPGEEVTLAFSKPEAVVGDTVTARHVQHEVSLGNRHRTARLQLDLDCSLAGDFVIELDPAAEIASLNRNSQRLPVRRDAAKLIIPVHAGRQSVEVAWRTSEPLTTVAAVRAVTLPVAGSNVTTVMEIPENRWVLWADGPQRGPAVRFWAILAFALLAALVLGSLPHSPLSRLQWILLALGLTQVNVVAAMWVIAWLFLLSWRGRQSPDQIRAWRFDLLQLSLVTITLSALAILIVVVSEGLLGNPKMFILGNGSWQTHLQWFQGRVGTQLPEPYTVSISVWFYRLLMLAWALWLATALLQWLHWGWQQFSHGGAWQRLWKRRAAPQPSTSNEA